MQDLRERRILLVVSGGIAAYKSAFLLRRLGEQGALVDVVMTRAAQRMVGPATFEALSGRPVHVDLWQRPLAHVELGRDAELAVVAPATANILAKMAHGLADDMATSTLLAAACPLLVCPAMNSRMWAHPATRHNVACLLERAIHILGPDYGDLAEGEVGLGRMVDPEVVVSVAGRLLQPPSPLTGRKVVVTAGPTRSSVDAVRYIGNRSSGRMGFALAEAAWRRGANVVLVTGPSALSPPYGVRVVRVEESHEMLAAVQAELPEAAALLMAAAVGDFVVRDPVTAKIQKAELTDGLELHLDPGPDVLVSTRALRSRHGVVTLGFALETEDPVQNGRRKLEAKGMDLVAVNEAGSDEAGFDVETNRVTVLDSAGSVEQYPLLSKQEVADRLVALVEERLA